MKSIFLIYYCKLDEYQLLLSVWIPIFEASYTIITSNTFVKSIEYRTKVKEKKEKKRKIEKKVEKKVEKEVKKKLEKKKKQETEKQRKRQR
jgi:hypothetical protein